MLHIYDIVMVLLCFTPMDNRAYILSDPQWGQSESPIVKLIVLGLHVHQDQSDLDPNPGHELAVMRGICDVIISPRHIIPLCVSTQR